MKRKNVLSLILTALFAAFIFSPLQFGASQSGIVAKAVCELSAEQIVNYFNSRVGESYTSNACLAFIADGFEALGANRDSACCAYYYGLSHLSSTSRDIPIGADVFFTSDGCKYDYIDKNGHHSGHIGVYVGDGYIVHSYSSKIQKMLISTVESHGYKYWGWGYHGGISVGPVSSNITIKNESYPTGNRPLGKNFGVYGEISSSYPLSRVWGGVYNADGTATPQYMDEHPNTTYYNLYTYFDPYIIFDDLPEGYYIYRIEATDNQGYSKVLVESEFSVGNPKTSNFELTGANYPPQEMPYGTDFKMQGTITSSKNLTDVKVGVYNPDGTVFTYDTGSLARCWVTIVGSGDLKIYDLSKFNDSVRFSDLLPGNYIYRVNVTDQEGNSQELINYEFSVIKDSIFGDEGITISINPVEISLKDLQSNNYIVPISVNAKLSPNFIKDTNIWEKLNNRLRFESVEFSVRIDKRLRLSDYMDTNYDVFNYRTIMKKWSFSQPGLEITEEVCNVSVPTDAKPGDVFPIMYYNGQAYPHMYYCVINSETINLADYGLVAWNDGYIKIKDELWLDETKVTMHFGDNYTIKANQTGLVYKTGDPDVAIVSKDGVVTAVGTGKTTILVYNSKSEVKQLEVSVTAKSVDGDINNDGSFGVTDIIVLQKWILHAKNAKLTNAKAADLNGDGVIDIFDLGLLKRKLISKK